MKTKVCFNCKQEKLVSDFGKSKVTLDKLLATCKTCRNIMNKEVKQRLSEYYKILQKKYNEDRKEKRKEYYQNVVKPKLEQRKQNSV